ncbi:MAG: tRNA pseudouridine(13) synthase TruD [Methanophagales archaeon]|nr:tRNA pseudouridine(13) synthase TruD [Methanophagales archaeon]
MKNEGVGGVTKTEPADFFVREITNRQEGEEGKYLIAELTKENWDTHSGIREISRRLRVSRDRIRFASTKDKFALLVAHRPLSFNPKLCKFFVSFIPQFFSYFLEYI